MFYGTHLTRLALLLSQEYFDKKPRPAKKAARGASAAAAATTAAAGGGAGAGAGAPASAGTVTTPYGVGTVRETRADGVQVVDLRDFGGVAYLQPNAINAATA